MDQSQNALLDSLMALFRFAQEHGTDDLVLETQINLLHYHLKVSEDPEAATAVLAELTASLDAVTDAPDYVLKTITWAQREIINALAQARVPTGMPLTSARADGSPGESEAGALTTAQGAAEARER